MSAIPEANVAAAAAFVDELARCGVREACISPGSRSAPIVLALEAEERIRKWVITDERSAAFFALGAARSTRRPAVVVSTSGTAAANFLPAVVESSLSCVPLVVVTADRPPELRDAGAAQTIRQPGLFATHARWSVDAALPDAGLLPYFRTLACRAVAVSMEPACGPVHVNLPLREPLFEPNSWRACAESTRREGREGEEPWTRVRASDRAPSAETRRRLIDGALAADRGLLVCGPNAVRAGEADAVVALAERLRWPILADPLSGLRFGRHDKSVIVDAYDVVLRSATAASRLAPRSVLRFGGLPSSKPLLRFLADARARHDVLVTSPGIWIDPSFTLSEVVHADAAALCRALASEVGEHPASRWLTTWTDASTTARAALGEGRDLGAEPFEGAIAATVAGAMPDGSILCIGNSMPVRDLDVFAGASDARIEVAGTRGASGIDGVLSAALGTAAVDPRPVVLLVGDLSFLHDLGALQIAHRHRLALTVVVANNDGGSIFSHLPQATLGEPFERYFVTPHGLDLEPAVAMAGGRHHRPTPAQLDATLAATIGAGGLAVVDVHTDRAGAVAAHRACIERAIERVDAMLGAGA